MTDHQVALAASGVERRAQAGVDLYWLPLGAGGHSVRLNGRLFEALAARLERREPCDLYHSALEVRVPEGRFVIEQAPIRPGDGAQRGVVGEGPIGVRAAGRFKLFRYEVRRWRDGVIPDVAEAVESPHRLSDDPDCARRLIELVTQVPTPLWGRDELRAGEMWNSNSVTSWLILRSGLDVESIQPPLGGRVPGWRAGIVIARRGLGGRTASHPASSIYASSTSSTARSPARVRFPACATTHRSGSSAERPRRQRRLD
jgi:hypothetical protein